MLLLINMLRLDASEEDIAGGSAPAHGELSRPCDRFWCTNRGAGTLT